MIRLHAVYGSKMVCRTYKNLKVAKRAFASYMLDRTHPDGVMLTVDGEELVSVGTFWY